MLPGVPATVVLGGFETRRATAPQQRSRRFSRRRVQRLRCCAQGQKLEDGDLQVAGPHRALAAAVRWYGRPGPRGNRVSKARGQRSITEYIREGR